MSLPTNAPWMLARLGRSNHFDSRNQPEDNGEGQRVYHARDDEKRHVAVEPLKDVTRDGRDDHSPDGTRGSSKADDRPNVLFGKHVRGEREDIGRPALVSRR